MALFCDLPGDGICKLTQCLACFSPLPHNLLSMSNPSFPFLIYFFNFLYEDCIYITPTPTPSLYSLSCGFLPEAPWKMHSLFFFHTPSPVFSFYLSDLSLCICEEMSVGVRMAPAKSRDRLGQYTHSLPLCSYEGKRGFSVPGEAYLLRVVLPHTRVQLWCVRHSPRFYWLVWNCHLPS